MALKFRIINIIHEERRIIVSFYSDLVNEVEVTQINGRPLNQVIDVPQNITTFAALKTYIFSLAPAVEIAAIENLKANPPSDQLAPFAQYIGQEVSE